MKSTLWPCLAALMLALGASACSESTNPSDQPACDPACGDGLVCNEVSGQCVGCLTNADCSAPASQCRMSDFVCVSCLTDSDCLLGYECNQTRGTCEEGEEPVECDATHPCDGAGEECVAGRCVIDVDCTPENEVITCPGSECTADGVCLNQKQVPCRDAAPAYATNLDATVTITWTAETQWSTPKACEWRCDDGFELTSDGTACETTVTTECTAANQATTCPNGGECTSAGTCLTSKFVDCNDAAPNHATSRDEQVSITWTASGGWSAPKNCQWSCDTGFERSSDGKACVAIATTECTTANQATTCPNGGECTSAGTCRTSKSVQCSDAAPSNATSTVTNVTIAWNAATGWDAPATCAWTCDDGFQKTADGKACEYSCMSGTCSDNAYCNSQHKLQSCGNNVCVSQQGCVTPTCTASSGCKATFETCNTTANSGLGECVPATCSSSSCSGDYACQGGKWTECAHGCASGSCKSAPVGCAAESNPDYCLEMALQEDNNNGVCDTSTGNCVECLQDSDCGTDQECFNNTCRDLCGNGTVNSGEQCDPNASSSTWQYQGKCSGVYNTWVGELTCDENCELDYADCTYCGNGIGNDQEYCDPTADKSEWDVSTCDEWAKYEGDTENTWIGELSCSADCQPIVDNCEVDGCANIQSEGECINNGASPVSCKTALGDEEGVIPDAYVICVPHDTCPGVMVMDFDATWAACVAEEKAVDWCRLQSHNGGYEVTLNANATSADFYGQINVNGITGTSGSGSNNIRGQFVYWDENFENMKTIDAIKTTYDNANNDEWKATVSVTDFAADGTYVYSWRFTADNGFSWYYCHNENHPNDSGTGAATTSASDVQEDLNMIFVTKPAKTTITENFANMTNRNSCTTTTQFAYTDTGSFVGNSSVNWEYKGFACATRYTLDENSKGVGLGQKSNNGNYLQASNIPAGIGVVTVKYKFSNTGHTGTLEIYIDGETTASATASIKGSHHDATTGFGTATLTVNKAGSTMKIVPKYISSNNTFLISEVSWTSYP